jgi:hypothetical protein
MKKISKENQDLIDFNFYNFGIKPIETIRAIRKQRAEEEIRKYGYELSPQQRYYYKKRDTKEFKEKNKIYANIYYHKNKDKKDFMDTKRICAITYYYKKKNNLI